MKVMADQHEGTRRCIINFIGQHGAQAKIAAQELAAYTKDKNASIRRESCIALGRIGPDGGGDYAFVLAKRLDDEVTRVRAAAATALAGLHIRSTSIIDISYVYFGLVLGCIDADLRK